MWRGLDLVACYLSVRTPRGLFFIVAVIQSVGDVVALLFIFRALRKAVAKDGSVGHC